jgi:hypothetical protein
MPSSLQSAIHVLLSRLCAVAFDAPAVFRYHTIMASRYRSRLPCMVIFRISFLNNVICYKSYILIPNLLSPAFSLICHNKILMAFRFPSHRPITDDLKFNFIYLISGRCFFCEIVKLLCATLIYYDLKISTNFVI